MRREPTLGARLQKDAPVRLGGGSMHLPRPLSFVKRREPDGLDRVMDAIVAWRAEGRTLEDLLEAVRVSWIEIAQHEETNEIAQHEATCRDDDGGSLGGA